ncbi:hypothetical protein K438DRAFT_1753712 [Mycena galopus ATCC 62051]|nr:hypothetical protein K438DRAFT_1753712 [Mycena galopus ATCC 62051]
MEADNRDEPTSEPKRVEDLWFEDGNIIIQAGNSQYRVLTVSICRGATVTAPDPEFVDGCPFVHLPDPEVETTPFSRRSFNQTPMEFDTVVGCLRLSHKYGVDHLLRTALVHFSSQYPTKLSHVNGIRDGDIQVSELGWKSSWKFPFGPASRIRVIPLARQVEAPWILPLAFYALSHFFQQVGAAIFNIGDETSLPVEDQISFLKGQDNQTRSTIFDTLRFLWYPRKITGCEQPLQCYTRRLDAMEIARIYFTAGSSLALHIWDEAEWAQSLRRLCPVCLTVLKRTHEDARWAFWDKLPEMYNLPSWAELEQMRASTIGRLLGFSITVVIALRIRLYEISESGNIGDSASAALETDNSAFSLFQHQGNGSLVVFKNVRYQERSLLGAVEVVWILEARSIEVGPLAAIRGCVYGSSVWGKNIQRPSLTREYGKTEVSAPIFEKKNAGHLR